MHFLKLLNISTARWTTSCNLYPWNVTLSASAGILEALRKDWVMQTWKKLKMCSGLKIYFFTLMYTAKYIILCTYTYPALLICLCWYYVPCWYCILSTAQMSHNTVAYLWHVHIYTVYICSHSLKRITNQFVFQVEICSRPSVLQKYTPETVQY